MQRHPNKFLLLVAALLLGAALPSGADWLLVHNWTIRTPMGRFGFEEVLLPLPTMTVTQALSSDLLITREVPKPGAVQESYKHFLIGPLGEVRTGISARAVKATAIGIGIVFGAIVVWALIVRMRRRKG